MAYFDNVVYDYVYLTKYMFFSTSFDNFAPIFAVLPAATLFCDSYNNGYIKSILFRTTKRKCLVSDLIVCGVSGGVAVSLPVFIMFMLFLFIGKPYVPDAQTTEYGSIMQGTILENIEFVWGGILVLLVILLLAFIFGMVWSCVGLSISAFMPNRYIALAAPFLIFFALYLICSRIPGLFIFSPINMLMPDVDVFPFFAYPFLYQFIWLIIVSTLYYIKAGKRLEDV